jgi:hypothetical protein
MKRLLLFSALTVCSALGSQLGAQATAVEKTRSLSAGAITAQISTGILGTATGFVAGGLVTRWAARRLGQGEEGRSRTALVGAYASATVLSAVGPALIGARDTEKGSFAAGVGGAAAGLATSALLRKIGRKGVFGRRGPIAIVMGAVIIALPSVGATVAFNSTR